MPHSGSGDAPAVSASPFASVLGYQQQAQLTRRYRLSDTLLALVEGGADAPILQMEREVRASMYARLFRWKAGCAIGLNVCSTMQQLQVLGGWRNRVQLPPSNAAHASPRFPAPDREKRLPLLRTRPDALTWPHNAAACAVPA